MKRNFLLFFFVLLMFSLEAQNLRYTKTVFEKSDTLKNVEYAQADWLNNPIGGILAGYRAHEGELITERQPLFMDIFQPHGDTLSKRPAILFAHSGGFITGSRHNEDMLALCDSFARRGYVTATMDYRLGMAARVSRFFGIIIGLTVTEDNGYRAVYRAVQDGRAAVRFFKHNAELYGIDTSKIFMVGSSAGAFVTLHNLYLDKSSEIQEAAFSEPSLGNLDTVGIQGYSGQVNAAVSMWGALENTGLIENNPTPLLLIHGTEDEIVPFKKGMPLKTLVPDNDAISFSMPETYGSFCIDTALSNRNIPHETYFAEAQRHEFYGVATGAFGDDGANAYYDTVQWKISNFLFEQFRPQADFEFQLNDLNVLLINRTDNIEYSRWEFTDGSQKTGESVSHTFSEPGNYQVKLTTCNENGACDTIRKTIKAGTPLLSDDPQESRIKVYPNPAQNELFIEGIHGNYVASVWSMEGKKRFESNTNSPKIDLAFLPPGIYIVQIQVGNSIFHRKIIKQK